MSTTPSAPLLPQSFWFRLAIPCPRVARIPLASAKRLFVLPESGRIVATDALEGREPWAELRCAWNPAGLAFSVEAQTAGFAPIAPEDAAGFRELRLWIDTRDTRDVSRATRFCHRYDFTVIPGKARAAPTVTIQHRPIARAIADAPKPPADAMIQVAAEILKASWRLDVFLPAAALHGFDPETNRRLGLNFLVTDPARPTPATLGVGREFPIGENPSLWSTLELIDGE